MSRHYRLSPEAHQQLETIGEFVARDSVDAAQKIFDAFEEAFGLIAENPGIGHVRDDLRARPVKF